MILYDSLIDKEDKIGLRYQEEDDISERSKQRDPLYYLIWMVELN